jgi:hypothetical protein
MSEVKLSLSIDTWKDIPNYEGIYQIDKEGNVKSTIRHGNTNSSGILKQRVGRGGYKYVKLSKNGKVRNCTIHRLVALTFIENPNNLPMINHKDENKLNNCVSNLEWCTNKYNINYGTAHERKSRKLTNRSDMSKPVIQYDLQGNIIREFPSLGEAARVTGFGITTIKDCCAGVKHDYKTNKTYKCNSCRGYIFKYK